MSHIRYTVHVLRAGQPRPYADTEHVVRVTFEWVPWNSQIEDAFEPRFMTEVHAHEMLKRLLCGYVPTLRHEREGHFDTYLEYLKPINAKPCSEVIPGGDPNVMAASIWEFKTVTPYTD